jgi:hypothetical protein
LTDCDGRRPQSFPNSGSQDLTPTRPPPLRSAPSSPLADPTQAASAVIWRIPSITLSCRSDTAGEIVPGWTAHRYGFRRYVTDARPLAGIGPWAHLPDTGPGRTARYGGYDNWAVPAQTRIDH